MARLWDAATSAALGPAFSLPGQPSDGKNVYLGPDGKTILFLDNDEAAWICDGATGTVRGRTPARAPRPTWRTSVLTARPLLPGYLTANFGCGMRRHSNRSATPFRIPAALFRGGSARWQIHPDRV